MKATDLNLKQKGNEYYSKGQYALASAMYRKYVKQSHSDNKNAYCNWSICAFKLQDYAQCIRICHLALDLDPTYAKVYYRLVQAHLMMKDEYGAMINAVKFCDIFVDDHQSAEYKQVYGILKKCRQKICLGQPTKISGKDSNLYLRGQDGQTKKQSSKTVFKVKQSEIDEMIQDGRKQMALNSLYQNLNRCENKQEQKQIMGKIHKIVGKKENINSDHKFQQTKPQITASDPNQKTILNDEIHKNIQNLAQPHNQNNITQQNLSNRQKNQQTNIFSHQKQPNSYEQLFLNPLQTKSDIFQGFYEVIISLIHSQLPVNQLSHLLLQINEKYPMFMALQMSLSQKQKTKLKQEMDKNVLVNKEQLIKIYCS